MNRREWFKVTLAGAGMAAVGMVKPAGASARQVPKPGEAPVRKDLPTLFLVGDSTLKSSSPLRGWGQEIGAYFEPAKINVVNRAIGGRSSRTFQTEGRWDAVLAELKPGDFLLLQFGHNDVGNYQDPRAKGRPSLHGEGDETAEVTKADGTRETVRTFGWYLRKYGKDARAKGATLIFCSMVPHKDWKDGRIQRGERATFVKWTGNAAKATGARYLDLNEIVAREYEKLGPEKVEAFFGDARTHYNEAGAKFSAAAVIASLKALDPNPLASYFSKAADAVAPAASP